MLLERERVTVAVPIPQRLEVAKVGVLCVGGRVAARRLPTHTRDQRPARGIDRVGDMGVVW